MRPKPEEYEVFDDATSQEGQTQSNENELDKLSQEMNDYGDTPSVRRIFQK